jgi:hypothetical protein
MAEGQLLAGTAQQDFLVCHQAAEPDTVDADAVHLAAARAGTFGGGGIGAGRHLGCLAFSGNEFCGADGGAGGGVHLVRMVELDDFNGFEVLGRLCGEGGGQHRAQGKVRRNEYACFRVPGQEGLQRGQAAGVPAGGAHHGVDSMLDGEADVRFGAFGDCQVHQVPGT